MEAFVDLIRDD